MDGLKSARCILSGRSFRVDGLKSVRCILSGRYFETSAATGEGVDEMFQQILQAVCQKRKATSASSNKRSR